jgi:hypothetical protein
MAASFRYREDRINPLHWTRQHRLAWLLISLFGVVAGALLAFIHSPFFFFDPSAWSSFDGSLLYPGTNWMWPPSGFAVTAILFYLAQLFRSSSN